MLWHFPKQNYTQSSSMTTTSPSAPLLVKLLRRCVHLLSSYSLFLFSLSLSLFFTEVESTYCEIDIKCTIRRLLTDVYIPVKVREYPRVLLWLFQLIFTTKPTALVIFSHTFSDTYSWTLCKWNDRVYIFLCKASFVPHRDSPMLLHLLVICSFELLSSTPLYNIP